MKKFLIIAVIAVAIFLVIRFVGQKSKLAQNLKVSIAEVKGKLGPFESTLDLKIKIDNPTEGEVKVGKPYVIVSVNDKELGRSTPDINQTFTIAKYASTEIPTNIKISSLDLAMLLGATVPDLLSAEKRKALLSTLSLDIQTMIDVAGTTIRVPLTYSLKDVF